MKLSQQLERVIFELKRGQQVILSDENNISHILLSSTETIDKKTLSFHRNLSNSYPNILLSPERCKKLNIKSKYCCSLTLDTNWTEEQILNLAFGKTINHNFNLYGVIEENKKLIDISLKILKRGKLLPSAIYSLINIPSNLSIQEFASKRNILHLNISELEENSVNNTSKIEIIARAKLPIKKTKNAEIISFQYNNEAAEYFCILIGKVNNKNLKNFIPTVRIHSQCVTGDIFHSLKCDCGEQLERSLDIMASNNEGILIYLPQEGRNIGLTNKIRAYQLQEEGLDTVDANLTLGFQDDERSYDVAISILKKLDFYKINLITNNPNKIDELKKKGLEILKVINLKIENNEINKNYFLTKKNKAGHLIN